MRKWRYSSTILDLDNRVISFTYGSLYLRAKSSRYPLDRRLDWSQSRSGGCGEDENLALPGIELGPPYIGLIPAKMKFALQPLI
jgi:hypothetical protein